MTLSRLARPAVLSALLILPACAQMERLIPGSGSSSQAPMPAATTQGMPSATTREYVRKAAIGDMFEIQTSRIALSQSNDEQIQRFARMMIDDHSRMSAQLQQAVGGDRGQVEIPSTLDAEHQRMLDQLAASRGPQFDRRYLTMQESAHREALQLHSNYTNSGDQPRLRQVAGSAVPVVQGHLDQLQMMRN